MDPVLGEEAKKIWTREWVRVWRCDVVIVAPGINNVLTFHLVSAVVRCIAADLVHGNIGSECIRIVLCREGLASDELILASRPRAVEIIYCLLVQRKVDGFDSVGVVVREFRVGKFLFQDIYTTIHDAQSV